jgi:hypothetical protein
VGAAYLNDPARAWQQGRANFLTWRVAAAVEAAQLGPGAAFW